MRYLKYIVLLFFAVNASAWKHHGDYLVQTCGEDNDSCGYADVHGKIVIPMGKYDFCFIDTFREMAVVAYKGRFVGINRDEKILFEVFTYDVGPDVVSEGVFRIIKNNKIGFADIDGRIIIKPQFSFVDTFSHGLAAFCENCEAKQEDEHIIYVGGQWGYINKLGKIAIPAKYTRAYDFEDGKAEVEAGGETFYIDVEGERVK